uniref:VWFA domain-containing protein n=1 Tax=Macrostomum lignano TaxID=282301 RepID=A0A1I8GNC6_9PLAT
TQDTGRALSDPAIATASTETAVRAFGPDAAAISTQNELVVYRLKWNFDGDHCVRRWVATNKRVEPDCPGPRLRRLPCDHETGKQRLEKLVYHMRNCKCRGPKVKVSYRKCTCRGPKVLGRYCDHQHGCIVVRMLIHKWNFEMDACHTRLVRKSIPVLSSHRRTRYVNSVEKNYDRHNCRCRKKIEKKLVNCHCPVVIRRKKCNDRRSVAVTRIVYRKFSTKKRRCVTVKVKRHHRKCRCPKPKEVKKCVNGKRLVKRFSYRLVEGECERDKSSETFSIVCRKPPVVRSTKCDENTCFRKILTYKWKVNPKNCRCQLQLVHQKTCRCCGCPKHKLSRTCIKGKIWKFTVVIHSLRIKKCSKTCRRHVTHRTERVRCPQKKRVHWSRCHRCRSRKMVTKFRSIGCRCRRRLYKTDHFRSCCCHGGTRVKKLCQQSTGRWTLNAVTRTCESSDTTTRSGEVPCKNETRVNGPCDRATRKRKIKVFKLHKCRCVPKLQRRFEICACPRPRVVRQHCKDGRHHRAVFKIYFHRYEGSCKAKKRFIYKEPCQSIVISVPYIVDGVMMVSERFLSLSTKYGTAGALKNSTFDTFDVDEDFIIGGNAESGLELFPCLEAANFERRMEAFIEKLPSSRVSFLAATVSKSAEYLGDYAVAMEAKRYIVVYMILLNTSTPKSTIVTMATVDGGERGEPESIGVRSVQFAIRKSRCDHHSCKRRVFLRRCYLKHCSCRCKQRVGWLVTKVLQYRLVKGKCKPRKHKKSKTIRCHGRKIKQTACFKDDLGDSFQYELTLHKKASPLSLSLENCQKGSQELRLSATNIKSELRGCHPVRSYRSLRCCCPAPVGCNRDSRKEEIRIYHLVPIACKCEWSEQPPRYEDCKCKKSHSKKICHHDKQIIVTTYYKLSVRPVSACNKHGYRLLERTTWKAEDCHCKPHVRLEKQRCNRKCDKGPKVVRESKCDKETCTKRLYYYYKNQKCHSRHFAITAKCCCPPSHRGKQKCVGKAFEVRNLFYKLQHGVCVMSAVKYRQEIECRQPEVKHECVSVPEQRLVQTVTRFTKHSKHGECQKCEEVIEKPINCPLNIVHRGPCRKDSSRKAFVRVVRRISFRKIEGQDEGSDSGWDGSFSKFLEREVRVGCSCRVQRRKRHCHSRCPKSKKYLKCENGQTLCRVETTYQRTGRCRCSYRVRKNPVKVHLPKPKVVHHGCQKCQERIETIYYRNVNCKAKRFRRWHSRRCCCNKKPVVRVRCKAGQMLVSQRRTERLDKDGHCVPQYENKYKLISCKRIISEKPLTACADGHRVWRRELEKTVNCACKRGSEKIRRRCGFKACHPTVIKAWQVRKLCEQSDKNGVYIQLGNAQVRDKEVPSQEKMLLPIASLNKEVHWKPSAPGCQRSKKTKIGSCMENGFRVIVTINPTLVDCECHKKQSLKFERCQCELPSVSESCVRNGTIKYRRVIKQELDGTVCKKIKEETYSEVECPVSTTSCPPTINETRTCERAENVLTITRQYQEFDLRNRACVIRTKTDRVGTICPQNYRSFASPCDQFRNNSFYRTVSESTTVASGCECVPQTTTRTELCGCDSARDYTVCTPDNQILTYRIEYKPNENNTICEPNRVVLNVRDVQCDRTRRSNTPNCTTGTRSETTGETRITVVTTWQRAGRNCTCATQTRSEEILCACPENSEPKTVCDHKRHEKLNVTKVYRLLVTGSIRQCIPSKVVTRLGRIKCQAPVVQLGN